MRFYREPVGQLADKLVSGGHVTVIPAYFGLSEEHVPERIDAETFELWRRTLRDAVSLARRLPEVRRGRIGVVGFSLGGFAASVEAAENDGIAALAAVSAGLSSFFPATADQMPATLVIHARHDPVVALADAEALQRMVRQLGGYAEFYVIESDEHIPSGEHWSASVDVIARFLDRAL
jgi:dienelactone hydrolase